MKQITDLKGRGIYHQIYLSRIKSAINSCRAIAQLSHPGEKGRIREILLRALFRPLLPADIGVGTGFIIGAGGAVSTQQDIVLYDRSVLPPALFDEEMGVFPIESVIYTIEVKSKITREAVQSSHNAAKRLSMIELHDRLGQPTPVGPRPTVSILALDSDLSGTGKSEMERYSELFRPEELCITSICVAGYGYWWIKDGAVECWPERYECAELVGYFAGILNALMLEQEERRSVRPPLGVYLTDFGFEFDQIVKACERLSETIEANKGNKIALNHCHESLVTLKAASSDAFKQYDNRDRILELQAAMQETFSELEQRLTFLLAQSG